MDEVKEQTTNTTCDTETAQNEEKPETPLQSVSQSPTNARGTAETEDKPETKPLQSVSQSSTNDKIISQADSTSADIFKQIESKELSNSNDVTNTVHSSSNESAVNISTETDTVKRPFDEKEEVTPKKLKEDPSQSTKDAVVEDMGFTNPLKGTSKLNENLSTTILKNKKNTTSTVATTSKSITTAESPWLEYHPKFKRIKASRTESKPSNTSSAAKISAVETNLSSTTPITNCYQMFLNIRKQIDNKRKNLFPVQPKPPAGFKDYLMNKRTYILANNDRSRLINSQILIPDNLNEQLKDMFVVQEKERQRLFVQHIVEKEKLVLSVEQEILRVHGRAARALANQLLPFSVCTILKDNEVYNVMTPEQDDKKSRHEKSCYNGRLFLSWLQAVDDKWEKIMESMLLRHHNEAESLHAVQRMDWECKLNELQLCYSTSKPNIDKDHVPMVKVNDDFDLLS